MRVFFPIMKHVCCDEKVAAAFSTLPLIDSSRLGEKHDVQTSDTINSRELILGSHESPEDNTYKISGENVSAGTSLGETTSSIEKDSCLLHSRYQNIGGCMQGGTVLQSMEKDSIALPQQSCLSIIEVAKDKLSAPLLRTFSRRLKRKADACDAGMFAEQPLREEDGTIKECDFRPGTSCTCEVVSKDSRLDAKSVDIKVESSDADMKNIYCQSSEKMVSSEIRDPSCPYEQSCAETLILRHTEVTSNSREELVGDTPPVTRQTTSLQKDDIRCSPCHGTVVSSRDVACRADEQPVSQQLRASSGDSQLTSSDSSDLKTGAAKRVEHRAHSHSLDLSRPPPGAFVIDCNVVPESDVHEEPSDIIQDFSTAKSNDKGKGLDLFGDNKTESQPKTKYLQLFSEDIKYDQFTLSHTHSAIGHSKGQQHVAFNIDNQRHTLEQSTSKASAMLGLTLPTRPIYEGQTSKDGSTIQQSQNLNVRTCDFIQNPVFQSIPDQASFRHKLLLESINTRATSLRGNRNISLDKFEPCPGAWSEEELDSLWIGIRRHGRGNWHAMLLDPRLRFAPWRAVGDLESQWDQEQLKLFSGKLRHHKKPQDGQRRESVAAETQLSLGDVYTQKDGLSFRGNSQKLGLTQAQRHVTMVNSVQGSVMYRGEVSLDGPPMTFGINNGLPHWLRDPTNIPSRSLDPPQIGGLRVVHGFPEPSGTSCRGKNLMSPPSHVHYGNPLIKQRETVDNPIVIESDASSEETISDDRNIRS